MNAYDAAYCEPACGECGAAACDCAALADVTRLAVEMVACVGPSAALRSTDETVAEALSEWDLWSGYAFALRAAIAVAAAKAERAADQAERDECCGDVCDVCADRDSDGNVSF
jgi:hypothetical protein